MASTRWFTALSIAILAVGCGAQQTGDDASNTGDPTHPGDGGGGGDGSDGGGGGDGSGGGDDGGGGDEVTPPTARRCDPLAAPGTLLSARAIGGGDVVATDGRGGVYYSADAGGVVKLGADGGRVYAYPHGEVFAVDAAGNAYLAGGFSAPIDLGLGRLEPEGNVDVFLVKLSRTGEVVFARALGLCGDGVTSIAVARDGRIAVSGTAMGTAILDAHGDLIAQAFVAGELAFDAAGSLYLAGSFTGSVDFGGGHVLTAATATDVDGFVVKLDHDARFVAGVRLGDAALPVRFGDWIYDEPRPQAVVSLAVNAAGEVAILGRFSGEMDLFGDTLRVPNGLPSGGVAGAFIAKLDASFDVVLAAFNGYGYDFVPTGAIAIDPEGNLIVPATSPSEAFYPNNYASIFKLDGKTGDGLWGFGRGEEARGYARGVATDPCGNVYSAMAEHTGTLDPLVTTLRYFAR